MTRLILYLFCATCLAGNAASRPNIIVIVADQWRAQATGYAGDSNVHTPNLDALARVSVNVTNAVSACPVCSPFRASLLTGQRPLTHGVFVNDVPLSTNAVTLAKVLKNAGYDTAAIGKWHIDGHGRDAFIPRERRQGFDYWKIRECSHDYNNSQFYGDTAEKLKWKGYDAFAQTEDAQNYIREHGQRAKPFFLLLAWGPPHNPYDTAPEQFRKLYNPEDIQLRPNVPAEFAERARKDLAGYYAHCTALDKCIGQIWQTLKEYGIERDAILVFSSDHGDMLGSHGNIRKQRPWDEAVRIPLLIHYPSMFGDSGRTSAALMSVEDFMPTLLGLCKVRAPKTIEGFDYSGFLSGKRKSIPDAVLLTCPVPFGEWAPKVGGREYRGIRTARYTYVRDLRGPWLFYDNVSDPFQMTNLCGVVEAKSTQQSLDKLLTKRLRETGDRFLPADDYMRKWGYVMDAHGSTRAIAR